LFFHRLKGKWNPRAQRLAYSRVIEREADHIGLYLMAEAKYDPREFIDFWSRGWEEDVPEPPESKSGHPFVSSQFSPPSFGVSRAHANIYRSKIMSWHSSR